MHIAFRDCSLSFGEYRNFRFDRITRNTYVLRKYRKNREVNKCEIALLVCQYTMQLCRFKYFEIFISKYLSSITVS